MCKTIFLHRLTWVVLLLMVVLFTACREQPHLGLIWPESGPALVPEFAKGADGTFYLMDEEGTLHAVTAEGQERWTYRGDHVSTSAPIVSQAGTSIYLASTNGKLISVGSDGKLQWTFKANDTFTSLPAVAPGGSIYLRLRSSGPPSVNIPSVITDSDVHTVQTVTVVIPESVHVTDVNGHTVVTQSKVIMAGANGQRVSPAGKGQPFWWPSGTEYSSIVFDARGWSYLWDSMGRRILGLSADGQQYRQCGIQGYLSAGPVMTHNDVLLYTLSDGTLVAQTNTCQELWRYAMSTNGKQRANYIIAIGPDDTVYVGGPDGVVKALSADSGQPQWQSWLNPSVGDIVHVIASDDGRVYAATDLANVLAFERGNLVWSQALSEPGPPGPLQTTREGGLALVQDGRLFVYTCDTTLARAQPTPVPPPADTAQAEQEIVDSTLDFIVLKNLGGTAGYVRNSGEPWLSNPPWAKLIIWAPANAAGDRSSNYLQSDMPIRVWWYTDNQLTETEDKQKSISEYERRYMKGLSAVNRYYEFGIVSIADDRQSAKVYVGVRGGGGIGYGSYYTLQRSPGGKWWIVKTEILWLT